LSASAFSLESSGKIEGRLRETNNKKSATFEEKRGKKKKKVRCREVFGSSSLDEKE
jgi:hypothetical protein